MEPLDVGEVDRGGRREGGATTTAAATATGTGDGSGAALLSLWKWSVQDAKLSLLLASRSFREAFRIESSMMSSGSNSSGRVSLTSIMPRRYVSVILESVETVLATQGESELDLTLIDSNVEDSPPPSPSTSALSLSYGPSLSTLSTFSHVRLIPLDGARVALVWTASTRPDPLSSSIEQQPQPQHQHQRHSHHQHSSSYDTAQRQLLGEPLTLSNEREMDQMDQLASDFVAVDIESCSSISSPSIVMESTTSTDRSNITTTTTTQQKDKRHRVQCIVTEFQHDPALSDHVGIERIDAYLYVHLRRP